jgi:hypothetical protein
MAKPGRAETTNGERIATGFLTTFTMLARDRLSLKEMSWMLVKVFFGYGGEDPPFSTASF